MHPLEQQDQRTIFVWFAASYIAGIRVRCGQQQYSIREWALLDLWLFNHICMTLLNKRIRDHSLHHMCIFTVPLHLIAALLGRVFVHDIWYIQQTRAAINTELVAFGILFR